MNTLFNNNTKQSGIVLVASLIFLLLLSLIGSSAMQTTIIQEKMAYNMSQVIEGQNSEARLTYQKELKDAIINTFKGVINMFDGVSTTITADENHPKAPTCEDPDCTKYNYKFDMKVFNVDGEEISITLNSLGQFINTGSDKVNLGPFIIPGTGSDIIDEISEQPYFIKNTSVEVFYHLDSDIRRRYQLVADIISNGIKLMYIKVIFEDSNYTNSEPQGLTEEAVEI